MKTCKCAKNPCNYWKTKIFRISIPWFFQVRRIHWKYCLMQYRDCTPVLYWPGGYIIPESFWPALFLHLVDQLAVKTQFLPAFSVWILIDAQILSSFLYCWNASGQKGRYFAPAFPASAFHRHSPCLLKLWNLNNCPPDPVTLRGRLHQCPPCSVKTASAAKRWEKVSVILFYKRKPGIFRINTDQLSTESNRNDFGIR